MQITDVSVTLFSWDDIPATQYGRHSGRFAGKSDLGLVTIRTDQGVEGHSFIGSSSRPASGDANLIVRIAKPMLMGEHPLDRERPLGAVDVAFGTLPARSPICPCTG
jgi:hypothetical protein